MALLYGEGAVNDEEPSSFLGYQMQSIEIGRYYIYQS